MTAPGDHWLRLTDDPATDELLSQISALDQAIAACRGRDELTRADGLERRRERLLRQAEEPRVLPTISVNGSDGSIVALQTPSLSHLAAWRRLTPAPLSDQQLAKVMSGDELAEVMEDWALLLRAYQVERELADQRADGYVDPETKAISQEIESALRELLQQGLRVRLGHRLAGSDLVTCNYLSGIGVISRGVRVCERCLRVFAAERAASCARCRQSPARASQREHHTIVTPARPAPAARASVIATGGDAGTALIGSITLGPARPTRIGYVANCQVCGGGFHAADARTRLCETCALPRNRTARWRARRKPSKSS